MSHSYETDERIVACALCPRLVAWREKVAIEKRRAFRDWTYWGRPIPNFGDPAADRLIVGLAPAAHGANRTGRMFTGDSSGDWLFRALHRAGVASSPASVAAEDGLRLSGVLITAVIHCAPPDNKPAPAEIASCRPFLSELILSRRWESILCLGSLAWNEVVKQTAGAARPKFGHAATFECESGLSLVASYHPSRQNTQTGRLSEAMLDEAIRLWLSR